MPDFTLSEIEDARRNPRAGDEWDDPYFGQVYVQVRRPKMVLVSFVPHIEELRQCHWFRLTTFMRDVEDATLVRRSDA